MGKPNTWVQLPTKKRVNDSWFGAEQDELYQRLVQQAYAMGEPGVCCCLSTAQLPISIRMREGRYHLARFPGTGSRHRVDCVFYAADSDGSGRRTYIREAIEETATGFQVRPDPTLRMSKTSAGPAAVPVHAPGPRDSRRGSGTKRETVGSLGLLHLLWDIAGLNVHAGMEKPRNWFSATTRLHRAADQVQLGTVELGERFLALPPRLGARDKERAERLLQSDGQRFCIVGRVARILGEQDGRPAAIRLSGTVDLSGSMDLWFNAARGVVEELKARYPAVCARAESTASRDGAVVALLSADIRVTRREGQAPTVRAQVQDAALMWVSREFVPVASASQLRLVDHLVAQARHFSGVLRYEEEQVDELADFELLDAGDDQPYPLLVLEGEGRVARRAAAATRYGARCWYWEPAADGDVPALADRPPD